MSRFQNMPIRQKLTAIVLMTCSILMAISALFFIANKFFEFRRTMVANVTTLARVIGMNSTAALVFQDVETAREILSALSAEPEVMAAYIFIPDGTLFAAYEPYAPQSSPGRTGNPTATIQSSYAPGWTGYHFSTKHLDLARPIMLNKKHIGDIVIRTNLHRLYHHMAWSGVLVMAMMVLLVLLAKAITARLHHTISGPLLALVATMEAVKAQKNYTLRAEKHSRDELGTLIDGFNGMLTEIEKRDQQLSQHRQQLEDQVYQRTQELMHSNEQLKQEIRERKEAQERLARAQRMEAMGTMAAGVAHDLNNILSGIVSYPDLLIRRLPADSQMRKPLATIQNSGQKAAAIVQDLLTLARRGVTVSEVVNLKSMVNDYLASPECAKMLSYHPDVELVTHFAPELKAIDGSPVHLNKTIMNLVSNAAEAIADKGTITIRLDNQYVDTAFKGYDHVQQGDYVRMQITDTGHGIAPEDLERIFEPFYTKKKMGRSGTGLGMAVVWGTVKDHQGYIDVLSKEGFGTTFNLYFPASQKKQQQVPASSTLLDYMGQGQSILVVDDVREQREIATDILTELGYQVRCVASGEAAVNMLQNQSVDLLLLDMIMDPGMDGLDTYRKIVQLHPHQRAIIASGYSESNRVKEAQKLGAGTYLRKPYTIEKLAQAVYQEMKS